MLVNRRAPRRLTAPHFRLASRLVARRCGVRRSNRSTGSICPGYAGSLLTFPGTGLPVMIFGDRANHKKKGRDMLTRRNLMGTGLAAAAVATSGARHAFALPGDH